MVVTILTLPYELVTRNLSLGLYGKGRLKQAYAATEAR